MKSKRAKKRKKQLRESQARLIAAQRLAKMGDLVWDAESGEVTLSDALFELLGYDKSDALGYDKLNEVIHHPDDRDRIMQWI